MHGMKKINYYLSLLIIVCTACNSLPSNNPDRVYTNNEKALSAQFMLAKDSSVIELEEGQFIFKNSLILEGRHHITIRGKGIDKTILSFKIQESGAEGLRIANCTNITLENFTVEDASGDNVKVTDTDGITFRHIKSAWTGEVSEKNGAYGLYPVLCKNVIIENCEVLGASDAGIYVGQSENVRIANNKAYWNVAGIESENCENVVIEYNEAYENTGGILIFDLPGLTRYGKNIKAYKNNVHHNNTRNFAPKGNIVGSVPPGTGFLVLSTRQVEIYDNDITDNRTIGVGIISYDLVVAMKDAPSDKSRPGGAQSVNENYRQDPRYNPYPGAVFVHDNRYSSSYFLPDLDSDMGKLIALKFPLSPPFVAWDGIRAPEYNLGDGNINPEYNICVRESEEVKVAMMDAANDFAGLTTDSPEMKCEN